MDPDPRGSMGLGGTGGGANLIWGTQHRRDRLQDRQDRLAARRSTAAAPDCSRPPAACCSSATGRTSKPGTRRPAKALWYSQIGGLSSPPETFLLDGKQHLLATGRRRPVHVRPELRGTGLTFARPQVAPAFRRGDMKQSKAGIFLISIGAGLLLAGHAFSQQAAPAPAAGAGGGFGRGGQPFDYADNEGWLSLFDGQTLTGGMGSALLERQGRRDLCRADLRKADRHHLSRVAGRGHVRLPVEVRVEGHGQCQWGRAVPQLHDGG